LEKTRGNPNRQEGSPFIKRDSKLAVPKIFRQQNNARAKYLHDKFEPRRLTIDQSDVTAIITDSKATPDPCTGFQPTW